MGAATPIKINIGQDIEDSDILAFTVERDMGQPDMAAIVLSNQESLYSPKIKVGDKVTIKVGDELKEIYKGEVVGLEAHYKGGEKARLTIRAMNTMHQLLRKRKSITFMDKSDQQILNQIAGDAGLSLEWKHDKTITYKHVYQHNQTDMEFLRMRAARMGCHVWCWDQKLFVKQPDLQGSPIAELKVGETGESAMKSFSPRLSSAAILKKVTVKGWNPETKELIQGEYSAQNSSLGSQNAVAGSGKLGSDETFTVDHPIWSPEEAQALAKARLVDLSLSYITGECEMNGDPKFDLGKVVKITASAEGSGADPFNGKYYIMGITHRHTMPKSREGGFVTILKLGRDAQKKK
jgi:phage protein D